MKRQTLLHDKNLDAAKRKAQARERAAVQGGERSQESMFFIAPSVVKTMKIRHRVVDFDKS